MTKVLANPGGICRAASAITVLAACGAFLITPSVASAQSAFTLGGTVIALRGSGLTLSSNGQTVAVDANGAFSFPTAFASGTVYNVIVATRPRSPTQGCLVANGRGTLTANVTNIQIACLTSRFTVGGTVTGLSGDGLALMFNDQRIDIAADGAFAYPTTLLSGTAYNVSVVRQPYTPSQRCVVTHGSGTVTDSNISNIAVNCYSLAVTGSTPAAGATDVSRNEPLVLNFSAPLDARTITGNNVELYSAGAYKSLDLSVSGPQLTITPQTPMLPASTYTIAAGLGLRATGGEELAERFQVNFTTREASWQGAQDIASAGTPYDPHITSKGDTFAMVWRQNNGTLGLNRYSPRTGWSGAAFLNTNWFIDRPQVFLDDAGTAHVIWEHNDGTLVSSRHTTDAGWSAIEQVPTDGRGSPRRWRGGMDDAGNIIAVWNSDTGNTTNSAWANRYVPGSGWDTPVQLEGSVQYVYDLAVAVDPEGNATAYWQPTHSGQPRLMSRRYTAGSGWEFAEVVNTDDGGVGSAHMAMRNGEAVAVYTSNGGVMAGSNHGSNARWLGLRTISTNLAGNSYWPQVAFYNGGNVFAVWVQRGAGPTDEVWGNARSSWGVWSTPRRIAVSTETFEELRLATDAKGNPLIIVKDVNATSSSILTGRYRSGAGWLVEAIETRPSSMNVHTPRIHTDASGSALAVWVTRNSNNGGYARANVLE